MELKMLVRSMNFIGDLKRLLAKANLTLSQHLLEKKGKTKCIFSLYPRHVTHLRTWEYE